MQLLHYSILLVALAFVAQAAPIGGPKSVGNAVQPLVERAPMDTRLTVGSTSDVSMDSFQNHVRNHINQGWTYSTVEDRIQGYRGILQHFQDYVTPGTPLKTLVANQLVVLRQIENSQDKNHKRLAKLSVLENTLHRLVQAM